MARVKKVIDFTSETSPGGIAIQPKRSTRKRKAVSYAEPKAEDSDWMEKTPQKKTKKSTATTASMDTTAITEMEGPLEPIASPSSTLAPKPVLKPKKKARKARDDEVEFDDDGKEIRKRDYETDPPATFEAKKARALSQPIAILSRERYDSDDYPQEKFTMSGSVGRQYEIDIKLVPKCTCPDYLFGRQFCKHIIYVLHYALKVAEGSEIFYQRAFTSSELQQLLTEKTAASAPAAEDLYRDGKRKQIEGECPICYMDLAPSGKGIIYCKAACGNNIHDRCMKIWIASQSSSYGKATCPMCRQNWID